MLVTVTPCTVPRPVVSVGLEKDLGYFITVQFPHGGHYYTLQYGHLQKEGRPANGSIVNAGDIVGIQGLSGNLAEPVRRRTAVEHVHIVAKKRNGNGWDLDDDYTIMDPEELLTTKFDAAGSPVPSSSCQ